jgi:class 3 adenylate cyclase/tetratricopeptide (TPR) repeat protein
LPPAALAPDQVLAWVPAAARARLAADPTFLPERRPAVLLFLRFRGLDYTRPSAPSRLDTYIRWVQAVLAHHGGSLLQLTIGDKGNYLHAAFGVPVAYGDSAARAAAAALALRTPPAGLAIGGAQIGLASGPVYAGPYGSPASTTYDALGPCVNLAARLMQAAGAGHILATAAVRAAAGARFAWRGLPPLPVKGETAPVPVSRLRGTTAPPAAAPDPRAPLVGRAGELATLRAALARGQAGHGQVLGVIGEAGLGKSRLVAAVTREAAAAGWAVYGGAAQSYGTQTAYLAWQGIWQAFFALDRTGTAAEQARDLADRLAEVAPALGPRMPLLGPLLGLALPDTEVTAGMEPAVRTESRVALLLDCLRARAAAGPVLLVLEDAHWLDPLSHDLLDAVARAIPALPVAVLLAYRPPAREHRQAVRVEELPHFTAVVLTGLGPADAAALVAARLAAHGGTRPPAEWIAALVARAAGNPFYLEELVAYARERGLNLADPAARAQITWPASLQSLLLARIDQLTEQARQVLKVASVVGLRFGATQLWGVHPDLGPGPVVRAALADLAAEELALPEAAAAEEMHRFKHAITHEVTYGTLPGAVRARLHEQFAAWLEARSAVAGAGPPLDLLAYHYGQSANVAKACEYLQRAGDTAAAAGAFAAAGGHYSALLARLDAAAPTRSAVLVARGDAWERLSAWGDAATDYAAARDQAGAPASVRAAAARGLGAVRQRQGDYAEAVTWLETARAEHATAGDHVGEARALAELGRVYQRQGAYAAAQAKLTTARAQAQTAGAPGVQSLALQHLGTVAWTLGDYATAGGYYAESLALRRELGDRAGVCTNLVNLGRLAANQGDYTTAHRLYTESLALRRALGDPPGVADNLTGLGTIALAQGDYAAAQAHYTESLSLERELRGERVGTAHNLYNLGQVALAQGDLAGAQALYTESLRVQRELAMRAECAISLIGLGRVALAAGDPDAARARFAEGLDLAHEVGEATSTAQALGYLGALAPESEAARTYLAESLHLATTLGPGLISLHVLVSTAGRIPAREAAALLGAVAALLAAQGARLEPLDQQAYDRAAAQARAALGEAVYAAAQATGQPPDWAAAVARARAALEAPPAA